MSENLDAIVASVLDRQLKLTNNTQTLSSWKPLSSGELTLRVMGSLGDEQMPPDLWLRYLLRSDLTDISDQMRAALLAYDTQASMAKQADAYAALGVAVVRLMLRATDQLLDDELADGYHHQQALRRYKINKSAEEASNV